MRSILLILSTAFVMLSCSSGETENWESIPFRKLHAVRVMTSFVSKQIDQNQLQAILVKEFNDIGAVHTPKDTSIDALNKVQAKPFALLTFTLSEVKSSDYETTFPVMCLSFKMYEEAQLVINKEKWMPSVWEKTTYVPILADAQATNQKIGEEMKNLIREFSKEYAKANDSFTRPSFYIGNPIH